MWITASSTTRERCTTKLRLRMPGSGSLLSSASIFRSDREDHSSPISSFHASGCGDVVCQQIYAVFRTEVDHLDPVLAKPVNAAVKINRFADLSTTPKQIALL